MFIYRAKMITVEILKFDISYKIIVIGFWNERNEKKRSIDTIISLIAYKNIYLE